MEESTYLMAAKKQAEGREHVLVGFLLLLFLVHLGLLPSESATHIRAGLCSACCITCWCSLETSLQIHTEVCTINFLDDSQPNKDDNQYESIHTHSQSILELGLASKCSGPDAQALT